MRPLTRTIQPVTDDVVNSTPGDIMAQRATPGETAFNCVFEEAAWSVGWWLLAPLGPVFQHQIRQEAVCPEHEH